MPENEPAVDVDALVTRLQAKVDEMRTEGRYPGDLEDQLDSHFRRLSAYRDIPNLDQLEASLERLRDLPGLSIDRIATGSRVPAGTAFHTAVSRVVSRQIEGVLQQVQESVNALRDAVLYVGDLLGEPSTHVHTDLLGQLDAILSRFAAYERVPLDSVASVLELSRRVEALELAESRREFRPWFDYDSFETEFRGTEDDLLDRYRDLASRFRGCDPVLDVGCGRGEFLRLLAEQGVAARGVDRDAARVEEAASRGLDVMVGDAVDVLAKIEDGALGGLAMIQVIEHLTPQEAADVARLASAKVRPGGRVIIETVNPQSLYVYAHSFYLDPTHVRPVHPSYLTFVLRQAGFAEVLIDWRSPPPEADMLQADMGAGEFGEANTERINRLLFAPQDYAVIATR